MKKGQTLIISLIFLGVILILTASLFTRLTGFLHFGTTSILKEQAVNLAEAGIDYSLWQLNQTNPLPQGDVQVDTAGTFTVLAQEKSSTLKTLTVTGFVGNSSNYRAKQTIKVDIVVGTAISFHYGVQVGQGGLTMSNSSTINGNIYSNGNIAAGSGTGQTINGQAYAVGSIDSPPITVTEGKHPGASPAPLPSIDYDHWRQSAEAGGTVNTCPCQIKGGIASIGPKKYQGDLSISNNALVTVTGPIYVTGNLTVSQGGTKVNLDESFGSTGTVIIVDGTITISQGAQFNPTSANPKGYILLVSTSTSSSAMSLENRGVNAILYALDGTAQLSQQAQMTAIVAKQISMDNSATLDYDQGLASALFTSGPGGSWQIRKGTYHFKWSW